MLLHWKTKKTTATGTKMSNASISDFSQDEINAVRDTLKERYGRIVATELADVELRLDPADRHLTTCPAIYWEDDDCHFVVCKIPGDRFYCQFFYRGYDQYGTGIREYDDLIDCVVTLLRVQADHQLKQQDL